jgi:hypothetical protein
LASREDALQPDAQMSTERPRFVYYVLPAGSVFAVAFGAVWGWIGIKALIGGAGQFGVLLVVFGIAGVALGLSLWRAWRLVVNRANGG